jgi:hypothetical protein
MVDEEIARYARTNGGQITSIVTLLDHLSGVHLDTPPDELVAQVDAALDRLYRAGRASFAGHRWLSEPPSTVAGFLNRRLGQLRFDATACTWTWSGVEWTENVTVR